jgi:glutamate racemase
VSSERYDIAEATPDAPIGVFDSGLGGLTVAREIISALPHESLVYFGDTARVPYGPKSPDTVRRYAREIASWLLDQRVKAVVVACNTATAHALADLQTSLAVPVIGVVEPGARAAVLAARGGSVGVIGTAGTIGSGVYERTIRVLDPQVHVLSRACPLFVPLVEEGWVDHPVTRSVAREYLGPLVEEGMDALVLGCTHYPLLREVIAETVGPSTVLVDSAERTAVALREELERRRLLASSGAPARHRLVASDAPEQMLSLGQRFLGAPIEKVERVTLG